LRIDLWGERLVDDYPTELAAQQDIERYWEEDSMWEAEKLLVESAVKAHMLVHGADRKTPQYWIDSGMGRA